MIHSKVKVIICDDEDLWNDMVSSSTLGLPDHLYYNSNVHLLVRYYDTNILFPFTSRKILGYKIALSFGLKMSGGPFVSNELITPNHYNAIAFILKSLLEHYDIVNITVKLHINKFYCELLRTVLKHILSLNNIAFSLFPLYSRVLKVSSYDTIWRRSYSKKARNAVRKFRRNNGTVKRIKNPLNYLKDILRCNRSSPVRQGRRLPRSYTDPLIVYRNLVYFKKYLEKNLFHVYGAFLDNKLVGYSYVISCNGYAYVSRFIIDRFYKSYCVGEGLLDGIIRELALGKMVRRIQYGYWSPKSAPGIDHFLRQFGFKEGKELAVFIYRKKDIDINTFMRLLTLKTSLQYNALLKRMMDYISLNSLYKRFLA